MLGGVSHCVGSRLIECFEKCQGQVGFERIEAILNGGGIAKVRRLLTEHGT